ncbi:MAG: hypothetical protein ACXABG_05805 [Promethearchaeota archaeon]
MDDFIDCAQENDKIWNIIQKFVQTNQSIQRNSCMPRYWEFEGMKFFGIGWLIGGPVNGYSGTILVPY